MTKYIKISTDKNTQKIFHILGNNNTRFVGGYVRDMLLNRVSQDIDIATTSQPDQVINKLNLATIKSIPTGIKFGTITAIIENSKYEITSLRQDINHNGRHSDVIYTEDWQIDASRRDFTINALSCSIEGQIFDYYDGLKDLENSIVKFIGNAQERIEEDNLRILRFFRFSQIYANNFDDYTLEIIKHNKHLVKNISGERIQKELFKILLHDNVFNTFTKMIKSQIMHNLGIINVSLIENIENIPESEKLLQQSPNLLVRLYLLSKDNLESIIKRWCIPNNIARELKFLLNFKTKIYGCNIKKIKDILFEIGTPRLLNILLLSLLENAHDKDFYKEIMHLVKNISIPKFPIDGNDIKTLGVIEGQKIGKLLLEAKDFWIQSDYISDKKAILDYLTKSL